MEEAAANGRSAYGPTGHGVWQEPLPLYARVYLASLAWPNGAGALVRWHLVANKHLILFLVQGKERIWIEVCSGGQLGEEIKRRCEGRCECCPTTATATDGAAGCLRWEGDQSHAVRVWGKDNCQECKKHKRLRQAKRRKLPDRQPRWNAKREGAVTTGFSPGALISVRPNNYGAHNEIQPQNTWHFKVSFFFGSNRSCSLGGPHRAAN